MTTSVGLVAFHYPAPEHRAEMLRRVHRAAEVMRAVPGCRAAQVWEHEHSGAIVATGWWDSEHARTASFAAVSAAKVDFDWDERETRPREVFNLVSTW